MNNLSIVATGSGHTNPQPYRRNSNPVIFVADSHGRVVRAYGSWIDITPKNLDRKIPNTPDSKINNSDKPH
jgi:hypothetical protein